MPLKIGAVFGDGFDQVSHCQLRLLNMEIRKPEEKSGNKQCGVQLTRLRQVLDCIGRFVRFILHNAEICPKFGNLRAQKNSLLIASLCPREVVALLGIPGIGKNIFKLT
jgi:hypothetical protein